MPRVDDDKFPEQDLLPKPTAVPRDFSALARPGRPKSVIVIGAGMAGLVAAYELLKLGYDVLVLEQQDRIGGRVQTYRFQHDGVESHAEAGAMRVPSNHEATLHYVHHFGLRTRRFVNRNLRCYYHIRDRHSRIADWPACSPYWQEFVEPSASNRYQTDPDWLSRRHPSPDERLKDSLKLIFSKLPTEYARTPDLGQVEELRDLSETSLRNALRGLKLSDASIEEMGYATGMAGYMGYSALEILAEHQAGFNVNMVELVDGWDTLPNALATELGNRVRTSSTVTSVELAADGASTTVRWSSAIGPQQQECDYVVCAVPTRKVREIEFTPALPVKQRDALLSVSYSPAAKTLVHVRRRFWEETDGILGGISYTNHSVNMLVYPSDNAEPVPEDSEEYWRFVAGSAVHRRAIGTETGIYSARCREKSRGPGVLVAYRWGSAADDYNHAGSDEIREGQTRDGVTKLHGLPANDDIIGMKHVLWPEAFAHFMPGEHHRHQPFLGAPYPDADNPRVVWAGEHLGYLHAWIQSAVVTAWDAVRRVAEAPGPL